ncbi:hypothetical protein FRC06_005290 [Ceratobasidium sp. 370]|nr:hypothetical protein FRC06_005290 [Ceratobasidium sp. 370]
MALKHGGSTESHDRSLVSGAAPNTGLAGDRTTGDDALRLNGGRSREPMEDTLLLLQDEASRLLPEADVLGVTPSPWISVSSSGEIGGVNNISRRLGHRDSFRRMTLPKDKAMAGGCSTGRGGNFTPGGELGGGKAELHWRRRDKPRGLSGLLGHSMVRLRGTGLDRFAVRFLATMEPLGLDGKDPNAVSDTKDPQTLSSTGSARESLGARPPTIFPIGLALLALGDPPTDISFALAAESVAWIIPPTGRRCSPTSVFGSESETP